MSWLTAAHTDKGQLWQHLGAGRPALQGQGKICANVFYFVNNLFTTPNEYVETTSCDVWFCCSNLENHIMAADISLEQTPSVLHELLSGLDVKGGNIGARALSASLSLHARARDGGPVRAEAERMRSIAECCGDLTEQFQKLNREG